MTEESNSRMGQVLFHELLKKYGDATLEVITHRGPVNETFNKVLSEFMGSGDIEMYKQKVASLKKEGIDALQLDGEAVGLACIGFIKTYLNLGISDRESYRRQFDDEESL